MEEIRQLNALLGLDQGQGSFGLRLRSVGSLDSLAPAQQETVRKIWARMDTLVLTVAGLCVQVLRMQGPDIGALVSASYDRHALPTAHPAGLGRLWSGHTLPAWSMPAAGAGRQATAPSCSASELQGRHVSRPRAGAPA